MGPGTAHLVEEGQVGLLLLVGALDALLLLLLLDLLVLLALLALLVMLGGGVGGCRAGGGVGVVVATCVGGLVLRVVGVLVVLLGGGVVSSGGARKQMERGDEETHLLVGLGGKVRRVARRRMHVLLLTMAMKLPVGVGRVNGGVRAMTVQARFTMIGRRNRGLLGAMPLVGDLGANSVRVQAGSVPIHPVVDVDDKAVVLMIPGCQSRRVNRHVRAL